MSSKPKFIIVTFNCPEIEHFLEGIRIISDPFIKSYLHLTVRGPYTSKLPKESKIYEWNNQLRDIPVKVIGVGVFSSSTQNTVFLNCEPNEYLRSIWRKPDFKEVIPHITMYDGRNDYYASKLLSIMSKSQFEFDLKIQEVRSYQSVRQLTIFDPTSSVNKGYFKKINQDLGLDITYDKVLQMNDDEKLQLISQLWDNVVLRKQERQIGLHSSYQN